MIIDENDQVKQEITDTNFNKMNSIKILFPVRII